MAGAAESGTPIDLRRGTGLAARSGVALDRQRPICAESRTVMSNLDNHVKRVVRANEVVSSDRHGVWNPRPIGGRTGKALADHTFHSSPHNSAREMKSAPDLV